MKPRHAVRAIILSEDDQVLLCRHVLADPPGAGVWAAPGGGVESGESLLEALRRELAEETGLVLDTVPPHVWHQEVPTAGVINDYFLVRTALFTPRGTMSDAELAAESISGLRWWPLPEVVAYRGPDLLSPRDLGTPLTALVDEGVPGKPLVLGL